MRGSRAGNTYSKYNAKKQKGDMQKEVIVR